MTSDYSKLLTSIKSLDVTVKSMNKKLDSFMQTNKLAGKRKVKDPNAPKRPRSAWISFYSDNRGLYAKKYPNKKAGEISKMMSAEWNKMSAAKKKKYYDMAEKDRARYEKEKKNYKPPTTTTTTTTTTKPPPKKAEKESADDSESLDDLSLSES